MGRHSSRKLQLEHAALKASIFMAVGALVRWPVAGMVSMTKLKGGALCYRTVASMLEPDHPWWTTVWHSRADA
jgi:hypothetical protein